MEPRARTYTTSRDTTSATGELMVRRHGLPLLYRVDPNSGRTFAEDAASIEDHREHELARDALDLSDIPTRDWPRIRLIAQWAAGRIVIESEPAPEMRRYVGIGGSSGPSSAPSPVASPADRIPVHT